MKTPTYSIVSRIGVALLAMAAMMIAFTTAVSPANAADEKADKPAAEEGKNVKPERDGEKPKGAAGDAEKPKAGEGDKGKPKEGEKPAAGKEKMNSDERDIFNAYDKDKDGTVSEKEMEAMFEGKQNSSGRRQIRKEIHRSDKNDDGKLNEDEFLFWYKVGRRDEKAENE